MRTIAQPDAVRLIEATAALCRLRHALALRTVARYGNYLLAGDTHSNSGRDYLGEFDALHDQAFPPLSRDDRRPPCISRQRSKSAQPAIAISPPFSHLDGHTNTT